MFIIEIKPHEDTKEILKLIQNTFGSVPPHFELLASLNPIRFEMFIKEFLYMSNHKNIDSDFFAFIRLHIAVKEDFKYCILFNTKLLRKKEYSKDLLNLIAKDINNIPFDKKHKELAGAAIKSIYKSNDFTNVDIKNLEDLFWTSSDIYDAIDHTAFLFKNSRIIKAYLK